MSDLLPVARRALTLMDLTTLNDDDTQEKVNALCHQAKTHLGSPAAVCIYPRFIPATRQTLAQLGLASVKIATVTNFPMGEANLAKALAETRAAIAYGADEVDVVFPWRALQAGDQQIGQQIVASCKQLCEAANVILKVIIESGELQKPELIRQACEIAINAGADFIKTSTGKVPVNATLEAAQIMLETIRDLGVAQQVGFKAAGGVKTVEDAEAYLSLADQILGPDWADARHFRFGASGLLNNLLAVDHPNHVSTSTTSY